MSITLCMIVKDEEKTLAKAIKQIKPIIDEIIIVDTSSKDKTKQIAKKFTKKVYSFRWQNDFAKARNFSISKATKQWILILDPDERIKKSDLQKIKALTKNKAYLGYRFIQKTIINNKEYIRGICRLFQRKRGISFIYPIHESVKPSITKKGKIGPSKITILHKPKYTKQKKQYYLKLLKEKINKYPESSAKKEYAIEKAI